MSTPAPSLLSYRPRFRADIEGLRAVAVFIVVAFHAKVPGFGGGYVGVDVFFVLSGYLITWLLVDEVERTGRIDLKRFYARRIRRLLPAMVVVLAVTAGVTAWIYAPFEQRALVRTWIMTALYASNIHFAGLSTDYHGPDAEINPLLHTWSLSVEEQFYVVWPLLIAVAFGVYRKATLARPRRVAVWLATATVLSFAASVYLTRHSGAWAFYFSPTRAWEFGVGGLAVLVPAGRWPRRTLNPATPGRGSALLAALGLAGLAAATVLYDAETPFPGTAALLPALATILLLRAGEAPAEHAPAGITRLLSSAPFQAIGKLSYSWYLWHWPMLVFADVLAGPLSLPTRVGVAALSLVPAVASYRWVEAPLRHHAWLTGRPSRPFALAVVVPAVTVLLAAAWWTGAHSWEVSSRQAAITEVAGTRPSIYADGCDAGFQGTEAIACVYGDSSATEVVVLVGDSHAAQWFPAIKGALDSSRRKLVVFTKSACPMVNGPIHSGRLGRQYGECIQWRARVVAAISRLRPTVVMVASASNYTNTPKQWEVGTRSMLAALEGVSDRVILILDPPYAGVDMPRCLARAAWGPAFANCSPRGVIGTRDLSDAQGRAAQQMRVEILDLRDRVAVIGKSGAYADGLIRYRDRSHLSRDFAETFAPTFRRVLAGTDLPPTPFVGGANGSPSPTQPPASGHRRSALLPARLDRL